MQETTMVTTTSFKRRDKVVEGCLVVPKDQSFISRLQMLFGFLLGARSCEAAHAMVGEIEHSARASVKNSKLNCATELMGEFVDFEEDEEASDIGIAAATELRTEIVISPTTQ
jgi:hypothetical protein